VNDREEPAAEAGIADSDRYAGLLRRIPELADGVAERLVVEIPFYTRLPRTELTGDLHDVIEQNLRLFARTYAEDRLPDDTELAEIRASAAVRAAKGVPVEAVIGAYHLGAKVCWEMLMDGEDRDGLGWMVATHDSMIEYLGAVLPAVAAAFDDGAGPVTDQT
jgi:hypothetical protein